MTINAPAAVLLLMYQAVGEEQGARPDQLTGTIQNDVLKEYIARGTYIYPPRPSLRLVADTFAYCRKELPKWNTISISGYHMAEAGATPVQEIAFTLANAREYVRAAIKAGLHVDEFAPRLSFFFVAGPRCWRRWPSSARARRLWARIMKEEFGAKDPRSQMLRFHTQTAGVQLTAQQPEVNLVRVSLQAVAAVLGEHPRPLPLAVTEDAGHRDLGVVIHDRLRHAAEECKCSNVTVAEGFRRLGRIADHEAGIRVRQVKSEEVDLALDAPDDADGFTKICLSMSWRMHQRYEHLLRPLPPTRNIVLHDREAAGEAVFVPNPLEDSLRRMLLLLRAQLVVPKNAVDHRNKWIKLRLCRRLLAHITRRHRELHHLVHSPRIEPEPSRRRPLAQALNPNRIPNPSV